jgi:phospholipid transport system substrate-binding protein
MARWNAPEGQNMKRSVHGLALALVLAWAPEALAGPPTDALRPRVERVIGVLEAQRGSSEQRRDEVRAIADEIFNFEETARRALGRHWNQRTPAERQEFVKLFTELLEKAYFSKIGQYGGERVSWVGESIDGSQAAVRTKIVTRANSEIPVEYRMAREGDRWRVYDVIIEGVSLVANYRTQFNRIIETASYEELVSRLRSRATQPGSS